jgi:uncharacterized coiled-coil protein SlyX
MSSRVKTAPSSTHSSTHSAAQEPTLSAEELRARLERLEVRSAFQEQLTQDLSDQVYALHTLISSLKAELEELKRRGTEEGEGPALGPALDRPPHY